ncbi:hypothetical protein BV912_13020, partial [Neisseria dumasiana]
RAFGGYLSDKFGAYTGTWAVMWVCWVGFFLLSFPQTDLVVQTKNGPLRMHIGFGGTLFSLPMFSGGGGAAAPSGPKARAPPNVAQDRGEWGGSGAARATDVPAEAPLPERPQDGKTAPPKAPLRRWPSAAVPACTIAFPERLGK